ncbi:MAG TPA: ABC transporter permease [Vicinamibacterales bacterium]|jgi:predicted permease|nr:ABC transporter permease [Vicinamibacterales bacterium]
MWARLRSFVTALFHRRRFEHDLSDELRFHLDAYAADLVRDGVPRNEAVRRARREFGRVDDVTVECRQSRGLRFADAGRQHVRYAFRRLRTSPGFTVTALATLAICLGAHLTIFAAVDAVLLRPLPFPQADRLVTIYNTYPRAGVPDDGASVANYYERRGHIAAFSALALYRTDAIVAGDTGSTERELVTRVTPDFFETLGVRLALGRSFTDAETTYESRPVAILTDAYWRERFDADPHVLGRTLRADGVALTIVGVLPRGFELLSSKSRIYLPLLSAADDRRSDRRHWGSSSRMIARLAPGVTLASAQSQIDAHNATMELADPKAQLMADAGFRSIVTPLHAAYVAALRPALLLVETGVLLLVAIGAVNVANLLLIRAGRRSKELAVRQALGASRRQIVAEVLVETTMLAVAGGVLGLAVGAGGIRLVAAFGASRLPLGARIVFDSRTAAITLIEAALLGLVMAAPVLWHALRAHMMGALAAESRTSTSGRAANRLRHAFLVAQTALAFTLLFSAGLLGLSLKQIMAVQAGFQTDRVLTGQVTLPYRIYDNARRLTFIDRLVTSLQREPGVVATGISTNVPLSGNANRSSATVVGFTPQPGEAPHGVYSYGVGADYFKALGLTMLDGRALSSNDARRNVAVVDEDFAKRYWPDGRAIGQRLFRGAVTAGRLEDAFTVVGVVAPVKQAALSEDDHLGAVYYPYNDSFDSSIYIVVRTTMAPEALTAALGRVVRAIDPELPVNNVRSMDARVTDSLVTRRSPAVLAAIFAGIALLLTAIGTYGVLSYAVAQRRREIGVRMALGATPVQVCTQFGAYGMRLLAIGSLVGVAGSWLSGKAMQALLFHTPPLPIGVIALVAATMGVVCLAACLAPSLRAARVSPTEVLAES